MSQQPGGASPERWDVALKVLNGPLKDMGEQVFRGPVVRLGANPGPGGLQLNHYRGLDPRQCVITAYSGGTASVAPVGTNQVRLAPHPNVNWKEIDPIRGPEFLSEGCAIHLGPVGRGATVQYVACRRFGVWQKGRLASEVSDLPSASAAGPASQRVPQSFDARRVGRISGSSAPWWFLGCTTLATVTTAVTLVLVAVAVVATRQVEALGPREEGLEFYDHVDASAVETVRPELLEGLQTPFYDFVMGPNIAAMDGYKAGLDAPQNWDQKLFRYTTASVQQHVGSRSFFARVDSVRTEYARVVVALRRAGLPEAFAAIPYQESRYQRDLQSPVCARGYWQFMPEVAYRVDVDSDLEFRVQKCRFRGRPDVVWSPHLKTPPMNVLVNGEYMEAGQCILDRCEVDDRSDIEKSTDAAIFTLGEAYRDPAIQRSGAAVQISIASHNSGYDDARFGVKKSTNLLPVLMRYTKAVGEGQNHKLIGEVITCPDRSAEGSCGSPLKAETQHYTYPVLAQHLLAVCYYAQNYRDEAAFKPWISYVTDTDGYCRQFKIPNKADVAGWKKGG